MPFTKTELGITAFQERSPLMNARQRAVFVLINGVRDTSTILRLTSGLSVGVEDLAHLYRQGLIGRATVPPRGAAIMDSQFQSAFARVPQPTHKLSEANRYQLAKTLATQISGSLGLLGLPLNLAVKSAPDCEGLRALLPRLLKAGGPERCAELERVLTP
jgi:hypothetical protein